MTEKVVELNNFTGYLAPKSMLTQIAKNETIQHVLVLTISEAGKFSAYSNVSDLDMHMFMMAKHNKKIINGEYATK